LKTASGRNTSTGTPVGSSLTCGNRWRNNFGRRENPDSAVSKMKYTWTIEASLDFATAFGLWRYRAGFLPSASLVFQWLGSSGRYVVEGVTTKSVSWIPLQQSPIINQNQMPNKSWRTNRQ
jgi:hypothetical protein